jgi:hypothetical protein
MGGKVSDTIATDKEGLAKARRFDYDNPSRKTPSRTIGFTNVKASPNSETLANTGFD